MTRSRDARLANLLGAVALGITDRVSAAADDAAQLDGRAPAALVALLDFSPNGSVEALSRIVGLSHSGGVRLVDRLANAGLAERAPGGDARSVTVALTERGRALAQHIRGRRGNEILETLAALSEPQRDELVRACELIIAELTRHRLEQRAAQVTPPGGALCRLCDFEACGRSHGDCPAAVAAGQVQGVSRAADAAATHDH